jgi:hypothetical protein
MSERITQDGSLSYRTKLLTLERAAAFSRALQANPRFAGVTIETSARAKSDAKYFVQFVPSNPVCVQAMLDRQQQQRADRAATQPMTFICDKDAGRAYLLCWSHTSGEVYELAADGTHCCCPDKTWRSGPVGLECKHEISAKQALAEGRVGEWG